MLNKKATLLLLLGTTAANNEAQANFSKEISGLEQSEKTAVGKQPILNMAQKSYSVSNKYLNEVPLGEYGDTQHQQALAGRKHHKHHSHNIQENLEKELFNNIEREEPARQPVKHVQQKAPTRHFQPEEPPRHFMQQRAQNRESVHAHAQARDSEIVDNGGHQIIYSRNPINQNEDRFRQHQPYIKQVRRDKRGHIHDSNPGDGSFDHNSYNEPRMQAAPEQPRREERFVIPRQQQPQNSLNRVEANGNTFPEAGSDLEKALRYRDVDKKEIKSALEIKLDKFDKIDEKYADYAKKVKDNQPKVEKDANIFKSELVDEKLQERIDRFHFLRDQVTQYSNEIEAAVAALHAERIVSESGRWEIPQDNYQNQVPLNGNQPRVIVQQPVIQQPQQQQPINQQQTGQQPIAHHQQQRRQYRRQPVQMKVEQPLYQEQQDPRMVARQAPAPHSMDNELQEAIRAVTQTPETRVEAPVAQPRQQANEAPKESRKSIRAAPKASEPVIPRPSPAQPVEQEASPAPQQTEEVKKQEEAARSPKADPVSDATKVVEEAPQPAVAAPVAKPIKKDEAGKEKVPPVPKEIIPVLKKETTKEKTPSQPKADKEQPWQTSVTKPEKAATKNIEIDETKEAQGTPSLVSSVTEGIKAEADLETAKALIAEKEQIKSLTEEYEQKMNQIKNPPFSNAIKFAEKQGEAVASSASTSGDITLNQQKTSTAKSEAVKKNDSTKSEEARSLYSDADLNDVVAHAASADNAEDELQSLSQKKSKDGQKKHHHHHKKHHHKKHHHHHHQPKDEAAKTEEFKK